MPDMYGPFDNAAYMQDRWYRDQGPATPSGVIGPRSSTAAGGGLGLTAVGLNLSMSLGRGRVRGAAYERTGTAWTDAVTPNASSAGPRRDLIVLRRDLAAKTVTPVRIQGTAAASPVDPAITQAEDGTWDEVLFRVWVPPNSGATVTLITDLRRWIDDDTAQLLPTSARVTAATTAAHASAARTGPGPMVVASQHGGEFSIPTGLNDRVRLPTTGGAGLWQLTWRLRILTNVTTPGSSTGNMSVFVGASPSVTMTDVALHQPIAAGDPAHTLTGMFEAADGDILLFAAYLVLNGGTASQTSSIVTLSKLRDPF